VLCADLDLAAVRSNVVAWLRRSRRAAHDRSIETKGAAMARAYDEVVFEFAFVKGATTVRAAITNGV
jgi:hypothetical protein